MSDTPREKALRLATFNAQLTLCEIKGNTSERNGPMLMAVNDKATHAIADLTKAIRRFDAVRT